MQVSRRGSDGAVGGAGSTAPICVRKSSTAHPVRLETSMTPKIALEEHCMTPGLAQYWLPTMSDVPPAFVEKVHGRLNDYTGERIEMMDRTGIAYAVLGVAGPGGAARRAPCDARSSASRRRRGRSRSAPSRTASGWSSTAWRDSGRSRSLPSPPRAGKPACSTGTPRRSAPATRSWAGTWASTSSSSRS